jgi:hypothetical protein
LLRRLLEVQTRFCPQLLPALKRIAPYSTPL